MDYENSRPQVDPHPVTPVFNNDHQTLWVKGKNRAFFSIPLLTSQLSTDQVDTIPSYTG